VSELARLGWHFRQTENECTTQNLSYREILSSYRVIRTLLWRRPRAPSRLRQSSSCNSRSAPNRNEITELIQGLGGLPRLFCTTDLAHAALELGRKRAGHAECQDGF
jgi:hypothetical protein